jgi:hypothetical protein
VKAVDAAAIARPRFHSATIWNSAKFDTICGIANIKRRPVISIAPGATNKVRLLQHTFEIGHLRSFGSRVLSEAAYQERAYSLIAESKST